MRRKYNIICDTPGMYVKSICAITNRRGERRNLGYPNVCLTMFVQSSRNFLRMLDDALAFNRSFNVDTEYHCMVFIFFFEYHLFVPHHDSSSRFQAINLLLLLRDHPWASYHSVLSSVSFWEKYDIPYTFSSCQYCNPSIKSNSKSGMWWTASS